MKDEKCGVSLKVLKSNHESEKAKRMKKKVVEE